MKALPLIFFLLTTAVAFGDEDRRKLTMEFPPKHAKRTFPAGELINFSVVLHALNAEDGSHFEDLVIDDWRQDTPNFFHDRRCPNVVLHVERLEGINWFAVGFHASSQGSGGGGSGTSSVDVNVAVGGDEPRAREELYLLAKRMESQPMPEAEWEQQIKDLGMRYRTNRPGRYRITATYTGLFKGCGRLLLTTGPVEVTVHEQTP